MCRKALAISLSKYVKTKALSPLPFTGKIRILFKLWGRGFFGPKKTSVTEERIRSKSNIAYHIAISFVLVNTHKGLVQ